MSLVYWDTTLFAYLLEAHPQFKRLAKKIVPGVQFIATLDTNIL